MQHLRLSAACARAQGAIKARKELNSFRAFALSSALRRGLLCGAPRGYHVRAFKRGHYQRYRD